MIPWISRHHTRKYLDETITYWRDQRDTGGPHAPIAPYYIDAYQSARASLLGETFPPPETDPDSVAVRLRWRR